MYGKRYEISFVNKGMTMPYLRVSHKVWEKVVTFTRGKLRAFHRSVILGDGLLVGPDEPLTIREVDAT